MAGNVPAGTGTASIAGRHCYFQNAKLGRSAGESAPLDVRTREHAQPGQSGLLLEGGCKRQGFHADRGTAAKGTVYSRAVPLPLGMFGFAWLRAYGGW